MASIASTACSLDGATGQIRLRKKPGQDFPRTELKCKMIMMGPNDVGKTTFINQFEAGLKRKRERALGLGTCSTIPSTSPTLGMGATVLQVEHVKGYDIRLSLCDIMGGNDFYRSEMSRPYFSGTQCAIVIFDLTNRSTLVEALRWKEYLHTLDLSEPYRGPISLISKDCDEVGVECYEGMQTPCLLVGNKCDAGRQVEVTSYEMEAISLAEGFCGWMEVSALNDVNVQEAVSCMLDLYTSHYKENLDRATRECLSRRKVAPVPTRPVAGAASFATRPATGTAGLFSCCTIL